MLLFVVEAEFNQRRYPVPSIVAGPGDQPFHGLLDVAAVSVDVFQRWPRQQPPLRPFVPGPYGLVIRIEQITVVGVKFPITAAEGLEDEDLEKMLDEMIESFILVTKSTSSI